MHSPDAAAQLLRTAVDAQPDVALFVDGGWLPGNSRHERFLLTVPHVLPTAAHHILQLVPLRTLMLCSVADLERLCPAVPPTVAKVHCKYFLIMRLLLHPCQGGVLCFTPT